MERIKDWSLDIRWRGRCRISRGASQSGDNGIVLRYQRIEQTGPRSQNLAAFGEWACAGQFVSEVQRHHPEKNQDKGDCRNED